MAGGLDILEEAANARTVVTLTRDQVAAIEALPTSAAAGRPACEIAAELGFAGLAREQRVHGFYAVLRALGVTVRRGRGRAIGAQFRACKAARVAAP